MDVKPQVRAIPTETYFSLVREKLATEGQAYVRVTGTSMRPLLEHLRDGVVIVPPKKIRWGDIVMFDRKNGRYALHRVIRRGKNGFTMAGDNQWHYETDLSYEGIVGVVSLIDRNGRLIPRENFFLKIYSFWVTLLTFPRIKGWKVLRKLLRPFRHAG